MRVTPFLVVDECFIEETFIRSAGPGGQNVNKVNSAVQLRFRVNDCDSFSSEVRARLVKLGGSKVTLEGDLIITAREHRSQERNRETARERLCELIVRALPPPKARKATKPTKASKERRVTAKKQRGSIKQGRSKPGAND